MTEHPQTRSAREDDDPVVFMRIRLPDHMRERVKEQAYSRGLTMAAYLRKLLELDAPDMS